MPYTNCHRGVNAVKKVWLQANAELPDGTRYEELWAAMLGTALRVQDL